MNLSSNTKTIRVRRSCSSTDLWVQIPLACEGRKPTCGGFIRGEAPYFIASFNIAKRDGIGQFSTDMYVLKGSTDTPRGATL